MTPTGTVSIKLTLADIAKIMPHFCARGGAGRKRAGEPNYAGFNANLIGSLD